MNGSTQEATLFDCIGGAPAINAAVDVFYDRVLADPLLTDFFANISMPRLKAHQFSFLSQTLGGPLEYTDTSMHSAHRRLAIEPRHFDAVATHLVETLKQLSVADDIIAEVGAAIVPLSSHVVNTPMLATAV